ncbi:MAG: hypothetical protein V1495_07355 [Pseudomonadota bacterium]
MSGVLFGVLMHLSNRFLRTPPRENVLGEIAGGIFFGIFSSVPWTFVFSAEAVHKPERGTDNYTVRFSTRYLALLGPFSLFMAYIGIVGLIHGLTGLSRFAIFNTRVESLGTGVVVFLPLCFLYLATLKIRVDREGFVFHGLFSCVEVPWNRVRDVGTSTRRKMWGWGASLTFVRYIDSSGSNKTVTIDPIMMNHDRFVWDLRAKVKQREQTG